MILDATHPVEQVFARVLYLHHEQSWETETDPSPADRARRLIKEADEAPVSLRAMTSSPALIAGMDEFQRLLYQCVEIFRARTKKYAGSLDTWDATFNRAAEIAGVTPAEVADVHVGVKIARREMGDGKDHHDDSIRDSVIDEINYRVLAVALRRVHNARKSTRPPGDQTNPPGAASYLAQAEMADASAENMRDALRTALRGRGFEVSEVQDTVVVESPLQERARTSAEVLQAEILATYDHLNEVLDEFNEVGGINHWRIPIKDAVAGLANAAAELRTCPTCDQPAPRLKDAT